MGVRAAIFAGVLLAAGVGSLGDGHALVMETCPSGYIATGDTCSYVGAKAIARDNGGSDTTPADTEQLTAIAVQGKPPTAGAKGSSSSRDGGRAGHSSGSGTVSAKGGSGDSDSQGAVDPCYYKADLSGKSAAMKGHTLDQGFVTTRYCPANIDIKYNKNFKSRLLYEPGVQTFTPYNAPAPGQPPPAAPVAPPPPSPEEVAQIAIANLPVPAPTLNMGPGRESAVVHQPLWLWVDDPGPITATANLVGVQVTAIAKLTKTTWNMGETVGKPGSGKNQQQAVVECPGAGTPAPAPQDLPDSPADWKPACGYSYQWRSTIARTGSQSCQWPVTAVTQWTVTWTSNLGVGGTTVLETRNTTGVNIAELRTVLVDDPNAQVATPAKPGCY